MERLPASSTLSSKLEKKVEQVSSALDPPMADTPKWSVCQLLPPCPPNWRRRWSKCPALWRHPWQTESNLRLELDSVCHLLLQIGEDGGRPIQSWKSEWTTSPICFSKLLHLLLQWGVRWDSEVFHGWIHSVHQNCYMSLIPDSVIALNERVSRLLYLDTIRLLITILIIILIITITIIITFLL